MCWRATTDGAGRGISFSPADSVVVNRVRFEGGWSVVDIVVSVSCVVVVLVGVA